MLHRRRFLQDPRDFLLNLAPKVFFSAGEFHIILRLKNCKNIGVFSTIEKYFWGCLNLN